MNRDDFEQTAAVLSRIPRESWDEFLCSEDGSWISERIQLARDTLPKVKGAPPKPVEDVLSTLGDGILHNPLAGPWVRAMVIHSITPGRWEKLRAAYVRMRGKKSSPLHGNATQMGSGADVMASYWHQGGSWALEFCEICGLPLTLASRRTKGLPDDETIEAAQPLPPLHNFQEDVYRTMRKLLTGQTGRTAILSLPTGAGKTRVAIEAILDHLALLDNGSRRNGVLWIAQTEELLRQAWVCFREVWQTAPRRRDRRVIPRRGLLTIRRAWGGGLQPDQMELDDGLTVLLAGIQQLEHWVNHKDEIPPWPSQRFAVVVVDEAHRLITPSHRDVLVALGLRKHHHWAPLQTSPLVVGLTATPWRTQKRQTDELARYFQTRLLKPKVLGRKPIKVLQKRGFLSTVKYEPLLSRDLPSMTKSQLARYEKFRDLPPDYLNFLGRHSQRNALIVKRLLRISEKKSVLVFACSVEHAGILTLVLNQAGRIARCVTGDTPRHERLSVIEAFRAKEVKFLCNVGVLTTGFDAPKINVVCITRPTASPLLYEQMVGRGLRGPKNGGKPYCLVLDVQDQGLPQGIMSYERVLELWEKTR